MTTWKSLYEEGANNSEIAATASEILFSTNQAKAQITKNQQSFNALEVNNNSNTVIINLDLDGLITRRRIIYPKSSISIAPEEGIFFNTVQITNTHAADALTAAQLRANARIAKAVKGS